MNRYRAGPCFTFRCLWSEGGRAGLLDFWIREDSRLEAALTGRQEVCPVAGLRRFALIYV